MGPIRIRLIVDLGIGEDAEFTSAPLSQRYSDDPVELAGKHLDRAVADARTWLAARANAEEDAQ